MGIKGAPIAINISSFCLVIMIFFYIYIMKIYVDTWPGWSLESLYDWEVYLKLAVPGVSLILIEWSSFEIATFASGLLGTVELDVMSIVQQVLYIFFQFVMINWSIGHSIFNFKTTLSPDEHKIFFHFLIINSRSPISDPDCYPSRIPVSDTRSRIQQ